MSLIFGKLPRPSLATWAALVFVAVAGLAALGWWLTDKFDEWAPNAAVEALSIAATILIVERIVRREARREAQERLWPRVELVMDSLRRQVQHFVEGVTVDYAETHVHTFRPLPRDALEFLDQWLEDKGEQDACAVRIGDDDRMKIPLVLHQGFELGKALVHYRDLDREVMEPQLVRAIDDFLWHGVQWGQLSFGFSSRRRGSELARGYASAETIIVKQARVFGEVVARYDPRGRIELADLTLAATQQTSEHLRARAGEIVGWRWQPRPKER